MKWAVVVLVLVAATACTLTQRETVLLADGVPITVTVSGSQTCIEVGEDADRGSWCRSDDMPEAVWMGATSIGGGLVVIGQAPPEVVSVDLAGEGGANTLAVEQTDQGRFFVGLDVQPGDYEVSAEREDGSEYVSGDISMWGNSTTSTMITP